MKLTDFDIDFIKFKNEKDSFSFNLNDAFFELKEKSLYDSGELLAQIDCDKSDATLTLDYRITGSMNAQCERCLKDIKVEIDASRNEVLKLTNNDELLKEETYLAVNYQVYNVYDSLYEEICLSLPTRKICKNSEDSEECEIEHPEDTADDVVDERWAELKKLIKK